MCLQQCYVYVLILVMSSRVIKTSRKDYLLNVDVTTSSLPDHNSFDYEVTTTEFSEVITTNHQFSLNHKFVFMFRNQQTFQVIFQERDSLKVEPFQKEIDLLGVFQIRYIEHNIILRFYEVEDLIADRKYGEGNKKLINNEEFHHIYVVVRSLKSQYNESRGYKLTEGALIKIGQKEYFISSVHNSFRKKQCEQSQVSKKLMLVDTIINSHKHISVSPGKTMGQCKYCMLQDGEEEGQFLCSPCKCSGSCALVHFSCLQKWNQSKVKKNQVKGLTYYNFDKFFCEVCKEEYPKFIEKQAKIHELMPIQMPKGEHLILEQIDLKCSTLICIENIPEEGIRMGRGMECEIRVDSPSISRNHARICKQGGDYYIYDNKSKFGTVIRDNKVYLQLDFTKKGIQIDRTVFMFQLIKKLLV